MASIASVGAVQSWSLTWTIEFIEPTIVHGVLIRGGRAHILICPAWSGSVWFRSHARWWNSAVTVRLGLGRGTRWRRVVSWVVGCRGGI